MMSAEELAAIQRRIESASRFSTDGTVRIQIAELRNLLNEVTRVRELSRLREQADRARDRRS
jgi:hypothetical protein